jgi:hypothetical protein
MKKILLILLLIPVILQAQRPLTSGGNGLYDPATGHLITGTFLPSDLQSLKLWLSSSSGVGLSGSNVASWTDLSSYGWVFTQGVGANQPLYSTTLGSKSKPTIRFDNSNDYLTCSSFDVLKGVSSASVFWVWKLDDYTDSDVLIDANPATKFSLGGFATSTILSIYGNYGIGPYKTTTHTSNAYESINIVYNGGLTNTLRSLHYYNGVLQTTLYLSGTIPTSLSAVTTNGLRIGLSYTGSYPLGGNVSEVLIFVPSLSEGDRLKVQNYLDGLL